MGVGAEPRGQTEAEGTDPEPRGQGPDFRCVWSHTMLAWLTGLPQSFNNQLGAGLLVVTKDQLREKKKRKRGE